MKRLLLSLVCCFPLFFSPSTSFSLDLAEPGSERIVSYEQYGPIASDETLWRIATKLRPNRSVTVQQTLVAIYKINPFAFYKGNINKIIPESVIKVPTLQFIQTQTNQEAVVLIAKYTAPKQQTALPISKPPQAAIKETVAPEISQPEDSVAEEKLSALENKLDTLRDELNFVNQQLSLVTAENQDLQLQLQPLSIQLDALKAQLESESVIQEKLQNIVEDYRAQLAAVKASPFSGDGLFHAVLRFFTSSITHLLIVIISPVLLVLAIFIAIRRLHSKHSLLELDPPELPPRLKKEIEESSEESEVDSSCDDLSAQGTAQEKVTTDIHNSVSSVNELQDVDFTDAKFITSEEELAFVVNVSQVDSTNSLATTTDDKTVAGQELELPELEVADVGAIDSETSADQAENTEQLTVIDFAALQEPGLNESEAVVSSTADIDIKKQLDSSFSGDKQQQENDLPFNVDTAQPSVSEVEKNNFIAIEKLLQKSESPSREEPYSELVVDLGLDEFPDVINAQYGLNDDENGLSAQLDLARAYLEIGDKRGAKKILLSVFEDSDGVQRSEIEKLLSRLA